MPHIILIGCGHWGQYILRDLKALNCKVTVVCLSNDSINRAREQKADRIVNSVHEIQNPDGIVIATPTITHLDVIESVVHFDVPIFVEKPLGVNVEQAKSIVKKACKKIFVMDKWRYHPAIEMLGTIAQNRELGDVLNLSITQLVWDIPHSDVDFINILFPHTFSMTQEILGYIPELTQCQLLYRENRLLGLLAWLGNIPTCHYHVAINSPIYRREILLESTLGFAVLKDSYSNEIEIYHKTENKRSIPLIEKRTVSPEMPLLRQLRVFIDFLSGGMPPKSDAYFGVQVMEKIEQLRAFEKTK